MSFVSTNLVLASESPRRREILTRLGFSFTCIPAEIDEALTFRAVDSFVPPSNSIFQQFSSYGAKAAAMLACRKAFFIAENVSPSSVRSSVWIIGADTIIEKNVKTYGKPKTASEAAQMLHELSGQTHQVITALSGLRLPDKRCLLETVHTDVRFGHLTSSQIAEYVATAEWQDAAGGYKIQESGERLIVEIRGSYSNVVGLPIQRLYDILARLEYPL